MKIEIKLPDLRCCNECPCMNTSDEYGNRCNLGYWKNEVWAWRHNATSAIGRAFAVPESYSERIRNYTWVCLRPEICTEENGE